MPRVSTYAAALGGAFMCASLAAQASSQVDSYQQTWEHKALSYQRTLDLGSPLGQASFLHSHNAYNSKHYQNAGSYWDPNHELSLGEQLDLGMRGIELDVHYTLGNAFKKELLLCHGQGNHLGCSPFDRRFKDGIAEISSWLRQERNRGEVVILYIEDHMDGQYDRALAELNAQLGDLIYQPGSCQSLPMQLTRADVLNAHKQVLIMGGNCSHAGWAATVYNYGYPTDNDTFQAYPACRTAKYDTAYIQNNIVRIYEDRTSLSASFGSPPPAIDARRMADLTQCGIGMIGLDMLKPYDSRLAAHIWSWAVNEPNDWGGNEDCAQQRADGRFNDVSCLAQAPFACRADNGGWKITASAGVWSQGEAVCKAEFGAQYRFAVPKNGYQNTQLMQSKYNQGYEGVVWLAYSDTAREGHWQPNDQPVIKPMPKPEPVYRKLKNGKGYCLDLEGRRTSNGTEIHQWSCHGADSQQWYQDDQGRLRSKMAPDKCVDVSGSGTGKGTRVVLWSCHDGANQRWTRGSNNSFRPAHAQGMALDIKDPFWGRGQRAHLWNYHGGSSQQWVWE